jgi:hypothetical protein
MQSRLLKSRWLRAALCVLLIPMLASPQLPVIDAASLTQIISQVEKAILLLNMATQTYNLIAYSAGWTPVKTPWLGIATPIVSSATRTIFGETAAWNPAVNVGFGIPPAWGAATYGINPPIFYGGFPLGGSSISANIASINVADGMSQAAMQTIANSRSNQPLNDLAIWNLEFASQDASAGTNSEVQQLNQINSGNVLANRQAEDEDALLTTIAEQQILTNKIQRDALADNLNVMSIRDQYIATSPTCWGGDVALFQSYSQ